MTLDWDPIQWYGRMIKRLKSESVESKRILIVLFMKANTGRQMLSINTLGRIKNADTETNVNKLTMNTARLETGRQL